MNDNKNMDIELLSSSGNIYSVGKVWNITWNMILIQNKEQEKIVSKLYNKLIITQIPSLIINKEIALSYYSLSKEPPFQGVKAILFFVLNNHIKKIDDILIEFAIKNELITGKFNQHNNDMFSHFIKSYDNLLISYSNHSQLTFFYGYCMVFNDKNSESLFSRKFIVLSSGDMIISFRKVPMSKSFKKITILDDIQKIQKNTPVIIAPLATKGCLTGNFSNDACSCCISCEEDNKVFHLEIRIKDDLSVWFPSYQVLIDKSMSFNNNHESTHVVPHFSTKNQDDNINEIMASDIAEVDILQQNHIFSINNINDYKSFNKTVKSLVTDINPRFLSGKFNKYNENELFIDNKINYATTTSCISNNYFICPTNGTKKPIESQQNKPSSLKTSIDLMVSEEDLDMLFDESDEENPLVNNVPVHDYALEPSIYTPTSNDNNLFLKDISPDSKHKSEPINSQSDFCKYPCKNYPTTKNIVPFPDKFYTQINSILSNEILSVFPTPTSLESQQQCISPILNDITTSNMLIDNYSPLEWLPSHNLFVDFPSPFPSPSPLSTSIHNYVYKKSTNVSSNQYVINNHQKTKPTNNPHLFKCSSNAIHHFDCSNLSIFYSFQSKIDCCIKCNLNDTKCHSQLIDSNKLKSISDITKLLNSPSAIYSFERTLALNHDKKCKNNIKSYFTIHKLFESLFINSNPDKFVENESSSEDYSYNSFCLSLSDETTLASSQILKFWEYMDFSPLYGEKNILFCYLSDEMNGNCGSSLNSKEYVTEISSIYSSHKFGVHLPFLRLIDRSILPITENDDIFNGDLLEKFNNLFNQIFLSEKFHNICLDSIEHTFTFEFVENTQLQDSIFNFSNNKKSLKKRKLDLKAEKFHFVIYLFINDAMKTNEILNILNVYNEKLNIIPIDIASRIHLKMIRYCNDVEMGSSNLDRSMLNGFSNYKSHHVKLAKETYDMVLLSVVDENKDQSNKEKVDDSTLKIYCPLLINGVEYISNLEKSPSSITQMTSHNSLNQILLSFKNNLIESNQIHLYCSYFIWKIHKNGYILFVTLIDSSGQLFHTFHNTVQLSTDQEFWQDVIFNVFNFICSITRFLNAKIHLTISKSDNHHQLSMNQNEYDEWLNLSKFIDDPKSISHVNHSKINSISSLLENMNFEFCCFSIVHWNKVNIFKTTKLNNIYKDSSLMKIKIYEQTYPVVQSEKEIFDTGASSIRNSSDVLSNFIDDLTNISWIENSTEQNSNKRMKFDESVPPESLKDHDCTNGYARSISKECCFYSSDCEHCHSNIQPVTTCCFIQHVDQQTFHLNQLQLLYHSPFSKKSLINHHNLSSHFKNIQNDFQALIALSNQHSDQWNFNPLHISLTKSVFKIFQHIIGNSDLSVEPP